jgi:hypothetical protein
MGGVKVPRCRIEGGRWRTEEMLNFGAVFVSSLLVKVIVPVSDGWPPPWAWKIVEGVVIM